MSASLPHHSRTSTPEYSGVEFSTSAEGFPVARVGDTVLAMLPDRGGGQRLASAWREHRPLGELKAGDFYIYQAELADEAAFRQRVEETAWHKRELAALNRTETRLNCHTPWGRAQYSEIYAEGVVFHSTASHGGFQLSPERNRQVDPDLRNPDGYYEEDEAWAIVALTFPGLFTSYERKVADTTIRNSWPEAWEAIYGCALAPGQSREKDRQAFEQKHAYDWIVIAALTSSHHPDMVETIATLGGRRAAHAEV